MMIQMYEGFLEISFTKNKKNKIELLAA